MQVEVVQSNGLRISPEWWSANLSRINEQLDTVRHLWEDYYSKDFITDMVLQGSWQAWAFEKERGAVNIVVLTQIVEYPVSTILQVILVFGNSLDECLPMMEATLERFARVTRCDFCEIMNARVGWERKLKRFRKVGVSLKCRVPREGMH